jgi:hypothetical protein
MKRLIVLLVLAFVVQVAQAQITSLQDSAGTAQSSWWNVVDLKDAGPRMVECRNTGSVNLYFAILGADTVVTSKGTRYTTVMPGMIARANYEGRYAFVKSASGTCTYHVGLVQSITLVPTSWRSFVTNDSIVRVRDAAAYSASCVMTNDSTAAKGKFLAFNVGASNGGRFIITDVMVTTDSLNSANGGYLLVLYQDTSIVNHIADKGAMVMNGSQFSNRVGEVIGALQTTGEVSAGTAATVSTWDYQTGVNLMATCGVSTTYIYARWVWLAAFQPAFHGVYRVKIKGFQEVLPQ